MNFFYLKHHYLSIVRSKSFTGEIFAFLILVFFGQSTAPLLLLEMDKYAESLALFLQIPDRPYEVFLIAYFFIDLLVRILLKRPQPKSHYYLFLDKSCKSISAQYLITSLFGIVPFLLVIAQATVVVKANQWLGGNWFLLLFGLFAANHYLGLTLQFAAKKVKTAILALLMLFFALTLGKLIPVQWTFDVILNPTTAAFLLLTGVVSAFFSVDSKLRKRKVFEGKTAFSLFNLLPTVNFKNPLFQLEWALIVRNKRTRSNLIMGLISVCILPFLLDQDSPQLLVILLALFATSFFIVQHGIYSLGWEGSYFDFLITNVSLKRFIESRYLFYLATCLIGYVLFLIPTIAVGQDLVLLTGMFLYNVGITIPLVLFRSGFNSQKIDLGENSMMNYNGMLTGPIMVTSLLVMVLPFIVFGIGQVIFGEQAAYLLVIVGIAGTVLRPLFINRIVAFLAKKKYHLSQTFKS